MIIKLETNPNMKGVNYMSEVFVTSDLHFCQPRSRFSL